MSAQRAVKLRAGDVLRYQPERHHCREGTAYVRELGGVAVDTYWHSFATDGESHVLTSEELATSSVQFNVADYDALDRYEASSCETWLTYHPDDRGRITSQHGLQEALFIRRGATPDLETQIANARQRIEEAESRCRSAAFSLELAQQHLVALNAASGAA